MTRRACILALCLLALAAACVKKPAPPPPAPAPSAEPAPAPAPPAPPQTVVLSGLRFSLPQGWAAAPESLTADMEEPPAAAFWVPGVSDDPREGNGFPFLSFTVAEGPGATAGLVRLLADPARLAESVAMRFDEDQQFTAVRTQAEPERQLVRLSYICLDVDSGEVIAGEDVLVGSQDGFVEVELLSRQKEDAAARVDFMAMIAGFTRGFRL